MGAFLQPYVCGAEEEAKAPVGMRNKVRSLERALADLIERRDSSVLTAEGRALIDRMIADLEAEIERRRANQRKPPP